MLLQTLYCLVYEFCLFVMWEIISQGPIKPCTFCIIFEVIFKDWLLLLRCCAYPLKPFILEQWNRLVWGLHARFSENFFETQGQNARIYNFWTTKLLSAWGPEFCVHPHFQKAKNTRLVPHEHLTKKLRHCFFCHQKWGVVVEILPLNLSPVLILEQNRPNACTMKCLVSILCNKVLLIRKDLSFCV